MILDLGDATFDIDFEKTVLYYAAEVKERCDCAYCRNFSVTVDWEYPSLRPLLARFGIDIDTPDESMPYDQPNEIWYENVYSVTGSILEGEDLSFLVDGVTVHVYADHQHKAYTACPAPRFYIRVGMMILPWALNEPMEDVLSPANEPSFLQKMWRRLLSRVKNTDITS